MGIGSYPVLWIVCVTTACAQAPAFEVASVKIHKPLAAFEDSNRESIDTVPGSLMIRNATLGSCIKWAFQIRDYQIAGPAFLNVGKYDISAKASGPARLSEIREMLQALLAERFRLQFHRETKELPVYALILAKSGPKLHSSEPDGHTDMKSENGSFTFRGTSMQQFADDLSTLAQVDRPVLDRTGTPGIFDFNLKFADSAMEMKRAVKERDGPSIFTIVQEQLGLKLEAQKGPIEMLVIDRMENSPTEN